jgi:DNA repair exonuclease SbcCD nuclease subunit
MVKIFVTGDNHFGKKYGRYPEVKDALRQNRLEAFKDMLLKAETEGCELFIITGDLFDSINLVTNVEVKQVVDIIATFPGTVIVLPGNHDYYTGDEKVWKSFEDALASKDHNVTLIKEFRPYRFETKEDEVVIYPAFCQSKHSKQNNLEWIKNAEIERSDIINIGLAHGALQGVTPDMNEEYFLMKESELLDIPVDVWLIGHTHIPYPETLKEDSDTAGYRIFNAGTHEQTDLHNNTEGNGFILTIDKSGADAQVMARKYVCGRIHFYDLDVEVKPDSETALNDAIRKAVAGKDKNSIIRLCVHGTVKQKEYADKEKIYKDILGEFLTYDKPVDDELSEEITIEKIRSEFAETSFAAQFLEKFTANPTELQMAYNLLQDCRG